MHFLYILYSTELNRYYVGESEKPYFRVKLHNAHHFKRAFTNAADDWELTLVYQVKNKTTALYLEKFIKKMKSKKFIEKIICKPSILEDILKKK